MRSGLRGLGDLPFGLLRTLNIPASMYGNPHGVKDGIYQVVACIALRFVVGIGRRTLCFGRFSRQLDPSNALHQFKNNVRSLTGLVGSFPVSLSPWVGAQTNEAYGHPNARRISSDALPLRCGYDRDSRLPYRSFEESGSATCEFLWAIASAIAWNVQSAGRDISSPAARTTTVLTSFKRLPAHSRSTRCIASARRRRSAATGGRMR